jgi:zinc transport system substrate-binding protein
MAGIASPELIVPPGASEHDYALRPSEAALLQDADLVVWVGPTLTPWLAGPIAALAPTAALVTLEDAPGIATLPIRAGGPFEPHADADEPAPGAPDGHLWLDPENAAAAATAIAAALSKADPEHAAAYTANATAFAAELAALTRDLDAELAPFRGEPFIVFHDAYQYFEHRFAIPAAGSVALHDAVSPGTARVAAIRDRVRDEAVVCAFTEPQFQPRLLATIIEGSAVRTGVLDPLGAALTPGPELYPALLRGLADSLAGCLGGTGAVTAR